MRIMQLTHTGINLYDEMAMKTNSASEMVIVDHSTEPREVTWGIPVADGKEFFAACEAEARANYATNQTQKRDAFYTTSEVLTGYVPGQNSIDIEIALATTTGNVVLGPNGEFLGVMDTAATSMSEVNARLVNERSPLKFEQQLKNLRVLYESLGADAAQYDEKFNEVIDKITAQVFLTTAEHSGMYVNADKQGVADSIKAAFQGEAGKYSIDDIKSMIILDFESMSKKPQSNSEFHLGAMFGFDAAAITAMQKNGKLSDSAAATVWGVFNKSVEDAIEQANKNIVAQKNDPFSPKNLSYSPINKNLIYDTIQAMIDAAKSVSFADGLRNALRMISEKRDAHIMSQNELTGMYDQRYVNDVFNNYDQYKNFYFNRDMEVRSDYLSRYMGDTSFAVTGNVLGNVDILV